MGTNKDPDTYFVRIQIFPSTSKKICDFFLNDFLSLKTDVNVPTESITVEDGNFELEG